MSRLETHQIISIDDTNLSQASKNDYNFKMNQFFANSSIKSIQELIEMPTVELESVLVQYASYQGNS